MVIVFVIFLIVLLLIEFLSVKAQVKKSKLTATADLYKAYVTWCSLLPADEPMKQFSFKEYVKYIEQQSQYVTLK